MPSPFAAPQIDFSALQQLGTIPDRLRMRGLRDDFSSGKFTGPNGEMDYNKMMQAIGGVNPMAAAKMAQSSQGAGGSSVFGTPIYGEDPNTGETVLGVIGRNGTFQRLDTGGVNITPGVQFLNQGTQFQPVDRRTARPVGNAIPIDQAGKAEATASGKAVGEAKARLPQDLARGDEAIQVIDQLIAHPGRTAATGLTSYNPMNYIYGEGKDFNVMKDQLQGQVFLQAYQMLKDGGQITEIEGAKAQAAKARLDSAQTEGEFMRALTDLREAIVQGQQKLREAAGVQGQPNAAPPQTGAPLRESDAVNQAKQAIQSNQMTVEQAVEWLRNQGIEVEDDR